MILGPLLSGACAGFEEISAADRVLCYHLSIKEPNSVVCEYATTPDRRPASGASILGVGDREGSVLSDSKGLESKARPKRRKVKRKVVVEITTSEEDFDEDDNDEETDWGVLLGMGTGKDVRRADTPSSLPGSSKFLYFFDGPCLY